jgi:hypothetical protein
MTDRTCATCRHWTPPSERTGYSDALTYRSGRAAEWRTARDKTKAADVLYGECAAITLCDDLSIDTPPPLATARDGSDYRADVYTQAEFFCAMWAAKEER